MTSCPNSLDQFYANFTNKWLQNFVQRCIFEFHINEYQIEGISHFVLSVLYFNNAECVQLLQKKPSGLIHIMDDQACQSHKKTDNIMVKAFDKCWENQSSFKVRIINHAGHPMFTVNHFNEPMMYSFESFLECKLDSLNPNFISLLYSSLISSSDGAEGVGSANPFVKGLFSSKAIMTQAYPKNDDTIISAQQTIKSMHALLTCCKGTIKHMAMVHEDGSVKQQD